jgi:hypothetical protein
MAGLVFAAVHKSAFGTKRTNQDGSYLSAFGGKADIGSPSLEGIDTDNFYYRRQLAWRKAASLARARVEHVEIVAKGDL